MRFRRIMWLGVLLLASCGPGAADRTVIPAAEAVYDIELGVVWVTPDHAGVALAGEWTCEGTCATTTEAVAPPAGVAELRSTFGPGGDQDRRTATWRGTMPAEVSVIDLPVVVGPDNSLTRVIVKCGGVTRTLLRPKQTWARWRLHLKRPGGACALEIRAIDDGGGWGQWIAIGAPEVVR